VTAPGRTAVVKVGSLAIPRRAVSLFATITMTVGGVIVAYVTRRPGVGDARFSTDGDRMVGSVLGLLVAFVGVATINLPPRSSRKAVSRAMADIPTSLPRSVVQVVRGRGHHAPYPGNRDDVEVTFRYHPRDPYSVRLEFSSVDPYDGSVSAPSVWEVARDALSAGAIHGLSSGMGDFRVMEPTEATFRLRLLSTRECLGGTCPHYDVHLSREHVYSFLLRTFAIVPQGYESDHVDVDGALARLLA
jgi:hypothetical protein